MPKKHRVRPSIATCGRNSYRHIPGDISRLSELSVSAGAGVDDISGLLLDDAAEIDSDYERLSGGFQLHDPEREAFGDPLEPTVEDCERDISVFLVSVSLATSLLTRRSA